MAVALYALLLRRGVPRLLFLAAAAAVVLGADVIQFSWRYQLPALITLPQAGALGLTLMLSYARARRRPAGDRTGPKRTTRPGPAARGSRPGAAPGGRS